MKRATKSLVLTICLPGAIALLGAAGCRHKKADDTGAAAGTATGTAPVSLNEGEIVGVMIAVTNALGAADSAAAGSILESPAINRYAVVLRADHRAIGQEIRAVADSLKVTALQSPTAERLRSEAAAITTALADSTIDRASAFVDAQVLMQRHLVGAMDSLLIPGARTPALRQVLTDLRPAMVAHLQRAEQLKQILATAETAGPRVAARISPDSARAPGDTLGDGGATGVSGASGASGVTGASGASGPITRPAVKPDSIRRDTLALHR